MIYIALAIMLFVFVAILFHRYGKYMGGITSPVVAGPYNDEDPPPSELVAGDKKRVPGIGSRVKFLIKGATDRFFWMSGELVKVGPVRGLVKAPDGTVMRRKLSLLKPA